MYIYIYKEPCRVVLASIHYVLYMHIEPEQALDVIHHRRPLKLAHLQHRAWGRLGVSLRLRFGLCQSNLRSHCNRAEEVLHAVSIIRILLINTSIIFYLLRHCNHAEEEGSAQAKHISSGHGDGSWKGERGLGLG